MSTLYNEMWEKLNLDLQAHEGLLAVLGKFYGDIYLTQDKRLQGHGVFGLRSLLSEVHGLRIKRTSGGQGPGAQDRGHGFAFWCRRRR